MKVLGIDPGTARAGWAVLEKENPPKLVKYGCIATSKTKKPESRLQILFREICDIVDQFKPDVLAIEDLFYTKAN